MAILTWQNVPVPDIGRTQQEGIRTAASLLDRAVGNATAGVGQLQSLQEAQRAAETQAADRFVLEKMLSTQDPNRYQQMRTDGSLLGPAASKVSNAMLLQAEARGDQLYNRDRTLTRDGELKAAESIWDRAAPEAISNPELAQRILATAKFSNAEDAAAFSERGRKLLVDTTAASRAAKKDTHDLATASAVKKALGYGKFNPTGVADFLDTLPPDVVGDVVDRLKQLGEDTSAYYGSNPTRAGEPAVDPGGNTIIDGADNMSALLRRYGNLTNRAATAAGPDDPPPGTEAWQTLNPGKVVTQGALYDWNQKHVLPASGKLRTTATGPAQIVNATRQEFAPKVFGDDWRNTPVTLENEKKLARAIYAKQGAKAWAATGMFKDLSAFQGKDWDEVEPLIFYIDGGVAPSSFKKQTSQFGALVNDKILNLSEGAKVILNAQGKENYDSGMAGEEVAKRLGKDTDVSEAIGLIDEIYRKAHAAKVPLTHAEVAGLLMNNIQPDGFTTVSDLRNEFDVKDGKLLREAKDLINARTSLKEYKKDLATLAEVDRLQKQYDQDKDSAQDALAHARRNGDAGQSAINAFNKWQKTSDRLAELVGKLPKDTVDKDLLEGVKQAREATNSTPMSGTTDLDPAKFDSMLTAPVVGSIPRNPNTGRIPSSASNRAP